MEDQEWKIWEKGEKIRVENLGWMWKIWDTLLGVEPSFTEPFQSTQIPNKNHPEFPKIIQNSSKKPSRIPPKKLPEFLQNHPEFLQKTPSTIPPKNLPEFPKTSQNSQKTARIPQKPARIPPQLNRIPKNHPQIPLDWIPTLTCADNNTPRRTSENFRHKTNPKLPKITSKPQ